MLVPDVVLVLLVQPLFAKVELPGIIASDMVLQRNSETKLWGTATAKILREDRKAIEVFCNEVSEPLAIRYAFKNVAEVSLYNCFGIPASPFRTDF